jgi:hypothetical protein
MDGNHYDEQTYAGDRADEVQRSQRNMPQEDRSNGTDLQADIAGSQSKELAPHVRMGDDRAIGSAPNWESMTSTQLHAAATQNNSPSTADNLGRAFNEGGNRLADAANRLLTAVSKLDQAWSGKAADAARGALAPLAASAGQAGMTAQMMGAQMARQTAAAEDVRKLPPPEEFDYQTELQAALANPNPVAGMNDMKAKKDKADAVKREQVSYLNAYTQTMSAVDSQTPSFIEQKQSITSGDGSKSHITGGSVNYVGPPGAAGRPNPHQGTSPGPSAPHTGASPGAGFGPPGSDGTDDQNWTPLPGVGGGPFTTGTSGYQPPQLNPPNFPAGQPVGGPHPGAPSAGSGGFGPGFGNFGPGGPGSGPGSAGRGPGAGMPGAGVPGEGAAARGGVGARGGAGMGGGMGAGRGGGKKEEDTEHDRASYLVEADPDSTFGTNEVTAPPVIGQE